MAVTIDASVGGASSNSYVTEVEQIAYMNTRLNLGAWTTISGSTLTDDEQRSLIEAQRELTRQGWEGLRSDDTQALAWPRQLVHDPDSPNRDFFQTNEIPQRVKDAASELAFQFIKAGSIDLAAQAETLGIKREKIDVLETEFNEFQTTTGLQRFPRVWEEIAPLLLNASSITAPLIKG